MECRVCDGGDLTPVVDLGLQPWANHFLRPDEVGREPVYPLRVLFCHTCAAAQLDYTVPKETMFGDHTYLSGVTRSLGEHFGEVATEVDRARPSSTSARTTGPSSSTFRHSATTRSVSSRHEPRRPSPRRLASRP